MFMTRYKTATYAVHEIGDESAPGNAKSTSEHNAVAWHARDSDGART
jgi:hypothetical protein